MGRERHPVALAEHQPAAGHPQRGEAVLGIARGVLAESDEYEAPLELVAVAPLDDPQRGVLGITPRASGVAEEGDCY
jgi:hypothetical protein